MFEDKWCFWSNYKRTSLSCELSLLAMRIPSKSKWVKDGNAVIVSFYDMSSNALCVRLEQNYNKSTYKNVKWVQVSRAKTHLSSNWEYEKSKTWIWLMN